MKVSNLTCVILLSCNLALKECYVSNDRRLSEKGNCDRTGNTDKGHHITKFGMKIF